MMIITRIHHFYDKNNEKTSTEVHANWHEIKSIRNRILSESDWRFMSDQTPSQEWIDYRQFLRDLPQNFTEANEAADAWNEYDIPE